MTVRLLREHLLAVAAGFLLFFWGGIDSPRRGHSTTMDRQVSQKSE
jgi:hypothetical protein